MIRLPICQLHWQIEVIWSPRSASPSFRRDQACSTTRHIHRKCSSNLVGIDNEAVGKMEVHCV